MTNQELIDDIIEEVSSLELRLDNLIQPEVQQSVINRYLALPALRGFWPMSSVDYTVANRGIDLSGQGNHLTDNNTVEFGYDNLAPYVHFTAANNEYLSRADGGAANWADIQGTETYLESAYRGLTMGCWTYFDNLTDFDAPMAKYGGAGQRSYDMSADTAANARMRFIVSVDGTALTVVRADVGTLTATTWHFFVGRFDPSTELALFHNNIPYTNVVAIPASIFDSTADFTIGARQGPAQQIDGRVSMAFLCAAYLPDAIILSLFEQTRAMYGV